MACHNDRLLLLLLLLLMMMMKMMLLMILHGPVSKDAEFVSVTFDRTIMAS